MPTERFSDEMLKQFEVTPKDRPKEPARWRDGSRALYLVPNRTKERTKALECSPEQWAGILRLSKEGSFHVHDGDPWTVDRVRHLRRAINAAIQKNPVQDPDTQEWVESFLQFLAGDGLHGFALSREWRRLSGR